jgi:hypothetical protein
MDQIKEDMEMHRKWCRIAKEGLSFCNHNTTCPRAKYFGLEQVLNKRYASYIKLLVQVPHSFSNQIPQLLQHEK